MTSDELRDFNSALEKIKVVGERYPEELEKRTDYRNKHSYENTRTSKHHFPGGEKGPTKYFTGTAWVNILVPQDETGSYAVGNVVFETGCRNNWHTHPAGQILLVTDGKAIITNEGSQQVLTRGDVVVIPSHVEHWHGAAADSCLTHIVITNNTREGAVLWLAPVTDEEYHSVQPTSSKPGNVHLTDTAISNHEELFPIILQHCNKQTRS